MRVPDGTSESRDLDAIGEPKVLLGDGASSYSANGLTRAASTGSTASLDVVFFEASPVCVTRSGLHSHGRVGVVLGRLVLV
jgi:hypothetical protein